MTAKKWFIDRKFYMRLVGGGTNPSRRSPLTLSLLIAMVGMFGMLGASRARGQAPEARVVAHPGPTSVLPTEPGIAAGPHSVVTVFYSKPNGDRHKAWYGALNIHTNKWARGPIDPNGVGDVMDVSIAHDANNGGFLAAGKTGAQIVTCRFEPGPETGELTPGSWVEVNRGEPLPSEPVDKPWIVAGCVGSTSGQEYYIVYQLGFAGAYHYLHSLDGGQSWHYEPIRVGDQEISGQFCAQPAVSAGGPLYVAYVASGEIRFLVGHDVPTENVSLAVQFSHLLESVNPDVPLSIPLQDLNIRNDVPPGNWGTPALSTVPYLAVDPTNPDRLYIVYQDIAGPGSHDVNIYLRELIKNGATWTASGPIRVNNDDQPGVESDQFLPAAVVDDAARIHVIFYDDRRYEQEDSEPRPNFDVYYAYSIDHGQNWTNQRLFLSETDDPPAMLKGGPHRSNPREYNGIAWYRYGDIVKVWTAYTGTDTTDPQPNDGVIWSSLIPWAP